MKPTNPVDPILRLTVAGPPEFELDEKNVINVKTFFLGSLTKNKKLFGRFGRIIKTLVTKHRTAYVIFDDVINALAAQKALNKLYLRDFNVTLYVNFCQNFEEEISGIDEMKVHSFPGFTQQFSAESNKENNILPRNSGKKSIYTFAQEPTVIFLFDF